MSADDHLDTIGHVVDYHISGTPETPSHAFLFPSKRIEGEDHPS